MMENHVEKKEIWRKVYQFLATLDTDGFETMNYGFEGEEGPAGAAAAGDERSSFRLYERVVGCADVAGKSVVEVGCGRGGGAAFIKARFAPRLVCGVDYSARAIDVCRQRYGAIEGLTFECGDAERLPFADRTFDAVVNVESSHCYPSRPNFFREAFRVLAPGGDFLFADIFDAPRQFQAALVDTGFEVVAVEDVTDGVLRSLDRNHDRRIAMFAGVEQPRRALLENLAAVRGSPTYVAFQTRRFVYESYHLRKPSHA